MYIRVCVRQFGYIECPFPYMPIKYAAEKLICQKLRYLYFIFYISIWCALFAYHIYGNYSVGWIYTHIVCGNITSQNVLKSICCSVIKLVAKRKNK